MTKETYRELFHCVAFPVFAIRRNTDEVIYKNPSCEANLPKFSKKNSLSSFIFSQKFSGIGPVKLSDTGFYHTAIALEDEEHSVFLFLSHLQYEEDIYPAAQLFQRFGPSLADFLAAVYPNNRSTVTGAVLSGMNGALYAESARILLDQKDLYFRGNEYLYPIVSYAFAKLNTAFSAMGYRVDARIDRDVPRYLCSECATHGILFVLARLLYLQMKLSKNKDVNLLLSCDIAHSMHVFSLTAETNLSGLSDGGDELERWLLDFIPEYKMEFLLLDKLGLLTKENFAAKIDRFGNLTLQYSVPYKSPESYYVQSAEMSNIFLEESIDYMLESLRAKLKDNGAFC